MNKKVILIFILSFIFTITVPVIAQEQLINLGKQEYEQRNYTGAIAAWEEARTIYQEQNNLIEESRALIYLSWAYQELSNWTKAETAIQESIAILSTQPTTILLGQALDTQANLEFTMGKIEEALASWEAAETVYQAVGDTTGVTGSRINQAQALEELGFYSLACDKLLESLELQELTCSNLQETDLQGDYQTEIEAIALHALGVNLHKLDKFNQAQILLEKSLAIFQELAIPTQVSINLTSLGNNALALEKIDTAIDYYQQAIREADPEGRAVGVNPMEAQLNLLNLLLKQAKTAEARQLITEITNQIEDLAPSQKTIYLQINLAKNWLKLLAVAPNNDDAKYLAQLLSQAIATGKELGDIKSQAYALISLGKLYEQNQQWLEAQRITQQALDLGISINSLEIIYQSQWQLARVLTQQGKTDEAIAANQAAIDVLGKLRQDLVAITSDVQFNFVTEIEPIYRNLVGLLLQPGVSQENLQQARQVIESLQLAELDNFFNNPCLTAKPQQIETLDPTAAVIYPIILPDRLEVVISYPNGMLSNYRTNLPQEEIEKTLQEFRSFLNPIASNKNRLSISQQIYSWLIAPVETQLVEHKIKNLVFVLDGYLRNIPLSALYDGEKYLIESYNLAIAPSLQLLESLPSQAIPQNALLAGLSEPRLGFAALPGVESEIQAIRQNIPSQVLMNAEFTTEQIATKINTASFPIVHLATHGQFSSEFKDTFLLTWDGEIDINQLNELLTNREISELKPIELLVLSACQTAVGDKRAALGLAGLAVRSGARSTIATLWSVSDQSAAQLMSKFYTNLTSGEFNKAEALRQAQLSLLRDINYDHPYYWSSFILIGNWL